MGWVLLLLLVLAVIIARIKILTSVGLRGHSWILVKRHEVYRSAVIYSRFVAILPMTLSESPGFFNMDLYLRFLYLSFDRAVYYRGLEDVCPSVQSSIWSGRHPSDNYLVVEDCSKSQQTIDWTEHWLCIVCNTKQIFLIWWIHLRCIILTRAMLNREKGILSQTVAYHNSSQPSPTLPFSWPPLSWSGPPSFYTAPQHFAQST